MIPFQDIKPLLIFLSENYNITTQLLMKINEFNLQNTDLWTVVENNQIINLPNIDRFEQTYNLFGNKIEFIQWKSFDISMKIYVGAKRLVFATTNTNHIDKIYTMARDIGIKNVVITMRF